MKDPAFLFYSSDFLTGVSDLTMEERGQYITLLCLQHQKGGRLSRKAMAIAVPNAAADVLKKFKEDDHGLFYNERLEIEIIKRAKHSEKQRQRALDGWKKRKQKKEATANAAALPLENENENEDIDLNKGVGWDKNDQKLYSFLIDKFKINEIAQPRKCIDIKQTVTYFKNTDQNEWFRQQCHWYFQYKEKEDEKVHGLDSFLRGDHGYEDGGWNGSNWKEKCKELAKKAKPEQKEGVYPSKPKETVPEDDLTKLIRDHGKNKQSQEK